MEILVRPEVYAVLSNAERHLKAFRDIKRQRQTYRREQYAAKHHRKVQRLVSKAVRMMGTTSPQENPPPGGT